MFSMLIDHSADQEEPRNVSYLLDHIIEGKMHYSEIVSTCKGLDGVDLLDICNEIDAELLYLFMENSILEDFMKQNDPKMLIGLTEEDVISDLTKSVLPEETDAKIKFVGTSLENLRKKSVPLDAVSFASSTFSVMKKSMGTSFASARDKKNRDYRLNYKAKVGLARKAAFGLKGRIRDQEKDAYQEFKKIESLKEETKYQLSEVNGTLESFNVNVVTLGCDPVTGIISSERFVKFCKQFLYSGMASCAKLRIQSNNLQQQISYLRHILESKQEKSGVLTDADFKTLLIKKEMANRAFKDQMNGVDFLKDYKGKVGYTLNVIRKDLIGTEAHLKVLEKKVGEVQRKKQVIEQDSIIVKKEREAAEENLRRLEEQVELHSAPKTEEYILLKQNLHGLEKERKALKQSIYLLSIRLKNAINKAKIPK